MLRAYQTVTVVNHWHDRATDREVYACHVMHGCSWFARQQRKTDGTSLSRAAVHQVRIPETSERAAAYREPQVWAALPTEEKAACWTLGCEAKLVLGAVPALTEAEADGLVRNHSVAAGLSWSDDRGGPLPHWYAEGS